MHNNGVIADPEAISEGFNGCFVNIGPTLAYKVPNNDVSHRRFLSEKLIFSLFLEPTVETEIKNIINKLKEGAPGRVGISLKNIKPFKDSISYPLAIVVNLSFEQGFFLMNLKLLSWRLCTKLRTPCFSTTTLLSHFYLCFLKSLNASCTIAYWILLTSIGYSTNFNSDFAITIQTCMA